MEGEWRNVKRESVMLVDTFSGTQILVTPFVTLGGRLPSKVKLIVR
jgi:hypothetical protein